MKTTNRFNLGHHRCKRIAAFTAFPFLLAGCASYHLSDSTPAVSINKLKHEYTFVCGIAPFNYEPIDKGDEDLMTPQDIAKWNEVFFQSINLSDICAVLKQLGLIKHVIQIILTISLMEL